MTLADQVTLARLGLMPMAVAAYLLLPVEGNLCFWVAALICGLAEYTDLLDGQIARRRNEVSDFGKLADPFCDVIYRIGVFLALLLPAGGVGWLVTAPGNIGQLVFAVPGGLGCGLAPWFPVFLMVLREVIAGALRAMTATKGLVLAARTSGKVKAWLQGITLITSLAFPAVLGGRQPWMLTWTFWATWVTAIVSIISILEYFWVNRRVLGQLIDRRPVEKSL